MSLDTGPMVSVGARINTREPLEFTGPWGTTHVDIHPDTGVVRIMAEPQAHSADWHMVSQLLGRLGITDLPGPSDFGGLDIWEVQTLPCLAEVVGSEQ